MAGAGARRKGRPHAESMPRALALTAGVTAAVAVATAAFAVQRHAVDEHGVVKDDGKGGVEYRVPEEEGRRQQEHWTEERVREAVRDSKPLGPLGIERD